MLEAAAGFVVGVIATVYVWVRMEAGHPDATSESVGADHTYYYPHPPRTEG